MGSTRAGKRTGKGEGFPGQRIVVLPRNVVVRAGGHRILRGLLPTDVGYFPTAAGHWRQRVQGIDQAIFIYCLKGRGWCELAGRTHPVQAGDLLVVPPFECHAYGADQAAPWTIWWVHAKGEHLLPWLAELAIHPERPVTYIGDQPQLRALFQEILEILERGYTPACLVYAAQTLAHLLGAMLWHRERNWRDEPGVAQRIAQTILYMKQHVSSPLRVPALAALANFSAGHYSALFKEQTGYAPMDYFIRLRMHRACQLLDTTRLSVKQIAAQVGYEDQLYFSRAFRQVNEISPTEYRGRCKG